MYHTEFDSCELSDSLNFLKLDVTHRGLKHIALTCLLLNSLPQAQFDYEKLPYGMKLASGVGKMFTSFKKVAS